MIGNYSFLNSSQKYLLRFNASTSEKDYQKILKSKNLNSYLSLNTHKKYSYKNKKYDRPYSWLIKGNKNYNLVSNNCVQVSTLMLLAGKLKSNDKKFKDTLADINFWYFIPNECYDIMLNSKTGKQVKT